MKKIIALVLAGILCATAAYSAIAVEDGEADTPIAPVVTAEEGEKAVNDLIAALEGDDQAQEIADSIADAVKSGATSEDVNALLLSLTDYINGKGYDVAQIRNGSKTKDFIGDFLEDCGVDPVKLGKALDEAGEVYDDMFGGADKGANSGSNSYNGGSEGIYNTSDYGVDSTTIPDTGYIG